MRMHHLLCFMAASIVVLVAGCGEDEELFANAQWRLRCPASGEGNCPGSNPGHEVMASPGPGVSIDCTIDTIGDDRNALDLTLRLQGDAGEPAVFKLDPLVFSDDHTVVSGQIQIEENGTYRGHVGAECEIPVFRKVDTDHGKAFIGEVTCEDLMERAVPTRMRDLTSATSSTEPATFSIANCRSI